MGLGGAIGGIVSGVIGASSANRAADAQAAAAANQLAVEKQIYDETTERFDPFYNLGLDYTNALAFELGIGPRPTFGGNPLEVTEFTETTPGDFTRRRVGRGDWVTSGTRGTMNTRYRVGDQIFDTRNAADEYAAANPTGGTEYQGFQETPGYQFELQQGLDAIDNSAASRGNLFSGATLKAAQTYGQGLANTRYGEYLNRLTGQASQGQAAAANQANAGANYAAGAGNAYANIGNAQAAGAIGAGNALSQGIANTIGIYNYQNQLANQQGGSPWSIF